MNQIRTRQARREPSAAAFTRTDLCAVLAAVLVVVLLAGPVLAANRTRVDRLVCAANLGEIGRAYSLWASDHGDVLPFLLTRAEGGIRTPYNGLEVNPWFQYSWISNELRTARVLACPSDVTRRPATDFSFGPGGLLHPTAGNNAISYFLAYPTYPTGHRILAGDRNIATQTVGGCSIFGPAGVHGVSLSGSGGLVGAPWTPGLHEDGGNLLLRDGSVEPSAQGLNGFVQAVDDNGTMHLLKP